MVFAGPGVLARGARVRPRADRAADQEAGLLDALGAEPRVQQVLRDARQRLRAENRLGGPGGHGAYQGYEAKYLAALLGKSGAPDIYMGMTHHWCGQYDFCDRMPADLAKIWDENLPKYMVGVGKWKGARYGIPIEHGNFQQMYINVDLMKKAGLDPDKPVKTLDDWLAAMKKLTVLDAKGETTQAGFALRHKGHPVGITDKFLPFAHAFGARMLSPNLEQATGFANSADMVAALQFYQDLVQKHKVASLAFPTPED